MASYSTLNNKPISELLELQEWANNEFKLSPYRKMRLGFRLGGYFMKRGYWDVVRNISSIVVEQNIHALQVFDKF